MDATKLHLILNYYPAFATVIGTVLLAVGLFRGSERLKRASLKLFIVVAVFTLPVLVTGEMAGGAGQRNGIYTGATAASLDGHKSLARAAFLAVEACGVAAIFGLLLIARDSSAVRWVMPLTLVIAIAASVAVVATVHLGRQVKWAGMAAKFEHREIVNCSLADCKLATSYFFLPINNLPINNEQLDFFKTTNTTEKKLWHA